MSSTLICIHICSKLAKKTHFLFCSVSTYIVKFVLRIYTMYYALISIELEEQEKLHEDYSRKHEPSFTSTLLNEGSINVESQGNRTCEYSIVGKVGQGFSLVIFII